MGDINKIKVSEFKEIERELKRFLMLYKFGLEEVQTKINILNEEFQYVHEYNPIDHIKSRIKSPESILKKIKRNGGVISLPYIKKNIKDIAGMRIICSFTSDIYAIADMLEKQKDLKVIEYKDYIENPKANGYQSLHLIIKVPVFLSDRVEDVNVEIQIRTIGMEFWASLEHKIYYKYNKDIPSSLKIELRETATIVSELDKRMEWLNKEIGKLKNSDDGENDLYLPINDKILYLTGTDDLKNSMIINLKS